MEQKCQILNEYFDELIKDPQHYNRNTYDLVSEEARNVNYALLLAEQFLDIRTGIIHIENGDLMAYEQIMGEFDTVMSILPKCLMNRLMNRLKVKRL
jgi:hypothetical protein